MALAKLNQRQAWHCNTINTSGPSVIVNCNGDSTWSVCNLAPDLNAHFQVVSPEKLHSATRWHLPQLVCKRKLNVPLFWTLDSGNPPHQTCTVHMMLGVKLSFDTITMQHFSRWLPMFVNRLKCGGSDASCFCAAVFHCVNQDTDRRCGGNTEGIFLFSRPNFSKYDSKEATWL